MLEELREAFLLDQEHVREAMARAVGLIEAGDVRLDIEGVSAGVAYDTRQIGPDGERPEPEFLCPYAAR